jgi:hypothetical protein
MLVPAFICSRPFLALHRFLRLPALVAISFMFGFVVLSALARRLVPTDILNDSIGYVPALGVRCLVALLALLRVHRAHRSSAPTLAGMGPAGSGRERLVDCYWRHRRRLRRSC